MLFLGTGAWAVWLNSKEDILKATEMFKYFYLLEKESLEEQK